MAIAYSYVRFSSKVQSVGDSYRRQTEAAAKYCLEHGLTLSEESYYDLGVSAFTGANRGLETGLTRFIAACESGVIARGSYLIVESLDRLSREQVSLATQHFLRLVNGLGIVVVTLFDNKVYSEQPDMTDLIVLVAIMERANEESETKSKRLKAAWANKRDDPNSKKISNCPFWLKLNGDKSGYEVIEEQADIVREIYQMSIDGMGIYKISTVLRERGVKPPRGKFWGNTSLSRVLTSKAVIGEYQHHLRSRTESGGRKDVPAGEPVQNYFPSIISDEIYYLSVARRKERKISRAGRKGNTFTNLFNNTATCQLCGARMIYSNKGQLRYLTCSEKRYGRCTNKPVPYPKMEQLITEVFLTPAFYNAWQGFVTESEVREVTQESLGTLHIKLDEANTSLEGLLSATADFSNAVIQKQIEARSRVISELEDRIENYKAVDAESKQRDLKLDFKEAVLLVEYCLKNKGEENELYTQRMKLNRFLVHAFDGLTVEHRAKGELFVHLSKYSYWYNKAGMDVSWYVSS